MIVDEEHFFCAPFSSEWMDQTNQNNAENEKNKPNERKIRNYELQITYILYAKK